VSSRRWGAALASVRVPLRPPIVVASINDVETITFSSSERAAVRWTTYQEDGAAVLHVEPHPNLPGALGRMRQVALAPGGPAEVNWQAARGTGQPPSSGTTAREVAPARPSLPSCVRKGDPS